MRIAVTGGGGYLGYHVTKYFKAIPFSRRTGFDITNKEQCQKLRDYDVIIHMATLVDKSEEQPDEVFRINAQGTLNVVQALEAGQMLISTSTRDVYTGQGAYAISKLISDKYVNYYANYTGFKAGIFRLSTTYAPPTKGSSFVNLFVKLIQEGTKISLLMEGKQKRCFLYVDDLSRAFEKFIDSGRIHEIYDIGGGENNSTTILGLVRIIEDIVGKKAEISFSGEKVKGIVHYIAHLSRISDELNWQPKISIEEGIRKLMEGR
ncbi:dTDP-glucose 4,6-dehydratase [subsurface metagenome]